MLLARHVEATHNLLNVIGAEDTLPTPRGELQAVEMGAFLTDISLGVVASSDRQRTIQTFDIANRTRPLMTPCRYISDDFDEFDNGIYSGLPLHEVYTPEIDAEARRQGRDFALPGGESINEAAADFVRGLEQCDGIGIVFTHNFTIKSVIGAVLDWDRDTIRAFKVGNGEIIDFDPLNPDYPVSVFKPKA